MALTLPETIRVILPNGAVKKLPLEEYVRGVVAAALPADAPLEAMKAQAVAARTFGANTRRHIERGADVCTLRHCQVWKEGASAAAGRAAGATRGVVALHNGRLIDAYYFEHCDGNTRDATGILMQVPPYLHGVACACGFAALKGHGIGMCQRGALVMARFGDTFEVILMYYYTGITLERAGVVPTAPTPTLPAVRPSTSPPVPRGSTADSKILSAAQVDAAERTQESRPSEEEERSVVAADQATETPVFHLPLTVESEAPPPAQVAETPPAPLVETLPTPVVAAPPAPIAETPPAPIAETPPAPVVAASPAPVAETAPALVIELPRAPAVEPSPAPQTPVRSRKPKAPKRAAKKKKPARTTKPRRSKKTSRTSASAPPRPRKGRKREPESSLETPAARAEVAAADQVAATAEAPSPREIGVVPAPVPPETASAPEPSKPLGVVQFPPASTEAAPASVPAHIEAIEDSGPHGIEAVEESIGEVSWYPVAEEISLEADRFEAEMIDEVLDASAAPIAREVESAPILSEVPAFPETDVAVPPAMEPSAGARVEQVAELPPAPETMPEEMPFSPVANVPLEIRTPAPPPPLLEEELGEAMSMGPVPEVLIDHLPGPRMIAGDLAKPGIIVTIRDAQGNAVVTVSGAAPHHGAGGFEAPLPGDGTYAVSFDHHALEVNLRDETVFICYGVDLRSAPTTAGEISTNE